MSKTFSIAITVFLMLLLLATGAHAQEQMKRKFGTLDPEVKQRIETAKSERLLEWGDRFVMARSLDEVFNGQG